MTRIRDDLTREPPTLPAGRSMRLQNLARVDEGLAAMGYSTQRGFGTTHPFVGEIRMGEVEIEFVPEELGFAVTLGEITLTECDREPVHRLRRRPLHPRLRPDLRPGRTQVHKRELWLTGRFAPGTG